MYKRKVNVSVDFDEAALRGLIDELNGVVEKLKKATEGANAAAKRLEAASAKFRSALRGASGSRT